MLDPDDEQLIAEGKAAGALLITWDRVVRLAAGGITPYEALEQAKLQPFASSGSPADFARAQAEVSRLHTLKPGELTSMAEAGNKTHELFQKYIDVNPKVAKLARQLRVEKDLSWRAMARFFSKLWGAPWGGNQLAGMVICDKAAKLLGEDFLQPPWN